VAYGSAGKNPHSARCLGPNGATTTLRLRIVRVESGMAFRGGTWGGGDDAVFVTAYAYPACRSPRLPKMESFGSFGLQSPRKSSLLDRFDRQFSLRERRDEPGRRASPCKHGKWVPPHTLPKCNPPLLRRCSVHATRELLSSVHFLDGTGGLPGRPSWAGESPPLRGAGRGSCRPCLPGRCGQAGATQAVHEIQVAASLIAMLSAAPGRNTRTDATR
jgi:hypothetical protein